MYIKLDDDLIIEEKMILPNSYSGTPKNVYKSAKRSQGKSLKMIKVWLGAVYEIKFTINKMKITKDFATKLRQKIMKPEINVEFYDDYSGTYKIQSCYCQDTEMKNRFVRGENLYYNDLPLVFIANQAAEWINN